jgi:hypothetical protein
MSSITPIKAILEHVVLRDEQDPTGLPLKLDLVRHDADCINTRLALDTVLLTHTDKELVPLWSHLSQQQREPFRGTSLQTALLNTLPGSYNAVVHAVAALETGLSLRWAYLHQLVLPRRDALFVYLFELDGHPLHASTLEDVPVFAVAFGTPSRRQHPSIPRTLPTKPQCIMRMADALDATIPYSKRWIPPQDAGSRYELLAVAWIGPDALRKSSPTQFYHVADAPVAAVDADPGARRDDDNDLNRRH